MAQHLLPVERLENDFFEKKVKKSLIAVGSIASKKVNPISRWSSAVEIDFLRSNLFSRDMTWTTGSTLRVVQGTDLVRFFLNTSYVKNLRHRPILSTSEKSRK